MRKINILAVIILIFMISVLAQAQSPLLAATLEVIDAGVEVKRVGTEQWIAISLEGIVGVGDVIRTTETGLARITFFANGLETELLPSTEYEIIEFEGADDAFTLTVQVIIGETTQRIEGALGDNSTYTIETSAMQLGVRGTVFDIRVDDRGNRSAIIVNEGSVQVSSEGETIPVPPGFGIRSSNNEALSDVVAATAFDHLDSSLDGCSTSVTTVDDVRINVRISPSLDASRVGTISAEDITLFLGETESNIWHRIPFRDGFGWLLSSSTTIDSTCAGLRVFADDFGPEDATLYSSLGDEIKIEDLQSDSESSSETSE